MSKQMTWKGDHIHFIAILERFYSYYYYTPKHDLGPKQLGTGLKRWHENTRQRAGAWGQWPEWQRTPTQATRRKSKGTKHLQGGVTESPLMKSDLTERVPGLNHLYRGGRNILHQIPCSFKARELKVTLIRGQSILWTSLIAQLVKNLPAIQETPVWFMGREHLLEKGVATHSSILGLLLWLSW